MCLFVLFEQQKKFNVCYRSRFKKKAILDIFFSTIHSIADSLGINLTNRPVADVLVRHSSEYISKIIKDTLAFAHSSRSYYITQDHINMVLESRNEQSLKGYDNVPIYATTPTNVDQSELFPSCESVKTLDEFINLEPEPIPRPMLQHYLWTLVEGTYIGSYLKRSQNPPRTIERSVSVPLSQLLTRNDGNRSFLSDTENPQYANDVLCSEYQKFYISVISLLRNDSVYSIENALDKITTEDKLQPILPYFLQFIMGKITTSLHSPLEMCVLIRFAIALALNRSIYLGIYVHSFLKIAFAGLTSLSLTDSICDDDLTIRNFSAELLRIICERCEHCFPSVKDSIFNALVRILFNPNVTINSHYGALIGITKIGEPYTERIIPHIHSYLRFIKKNKQKLRERKTINEIIKITEQLCSKQKNNKTLLVNKMM